MHRANQHATNGLGDDEVASHERRPVAGSWDYGLPFDASERDMTQRYDPIATQPITHTSRAAVTMPPPRASASMSPRFPNQSSVASLSSVNPRPLRSLPARDVTDETFDQAYVDFILYANPQFALDRDTSELRRIFRIPPRSDGKDFSIYRIWELVRKFETKEIKTWAQLALELGVEPPNTEAGGSVQKVQQYVVRLKRWLRAMHIDAFFEYLLGKPHIYYTERPEVDDPYPPHGRDGILADEDLALRALEPSFRPKRGRKRNESPEEDSQRAKRLATTTSYSLTTKDRQLDGQPSSAYSSDALPPSAHPDSISQQTWDTSPAFLPSGFYHRPQPGQSDAFFELAGNDMPISALEEPLSAITPVRDRGRRTVSSAWNSNGASTGKPRGRPPGSRLAQDTPFTTFPVNPSTSNNGPTIAGESPVVGPTATPTQSRVRGEKLQLQVPQHASTPVQLMQHHLSTSDTADGPRNTESSRPANAGNQSASPGYAYEVLKRSLASSLIMGTLSGRPTRLTAHEAKCLADKILTHFGMPLEDTDDKSDDAIRISAASWLGVSAQLGFHGGRGRLGSGKRVVVRRFGVDAEGYEYPLPYEEANNQNKNNNAPTAQMTSEDNGPSDTKTKELFDISWSLGIGGVNADFSIDGLEISDADVERDVNNSTGGTATWRRIDRLVDEQTESVQAEVRARQEKGNDLAQDVEGINWKQKYYEILMTSKIMQGFLEKSREKLLDAVLSL